MRNTEFNIEKIKISPGLVLAPMSGVTNSAFRRLIKLENPKTVGLVVTEFISIEGLTRQNLKSLNMMKYAEWERPISIQIFGSDLERMVEAAKMVEDAGADILDINSGCPVPRVVKRGGGCELMRQPEHLGKMLAAVKQAIKIPLTLKCRTGWDEKHRNVFEIAKIAEDSGVAMLAVHGRTRVQLYRGEADWQVIEQVANTVKIPVIGSGDVTSAGFAQQVFKNNIAGLMIGRGALQNPWIFNELVEGPADTKQAIPELVRVIKRYTELLKEDFPDKAIIGKLKQLATQAIREFRGAQELRKALCLTPNLQLFLETLGRAEEIVSAAAVSGFEQIDASDSAFQVEAEHVNDRSYA
ncbi:tRNA dihydrouridine synthase DusB [bacterium]|nr:tRNA dihydrouridine synthase DusB [bacterium]